MTESVTFGDVRPSNRTLLLAICGAQLILIVGPLLKFGEAGPPVAVLCLLSAVAVLGSLTTALFFLCLISAIIPSTAFDTVVKLPGNVFFVEAVYVVIAALAGMTWVFRRKLSWRRTPLDRPMVVFLALVAVSCGIGLMYGQSTSRMLRDVRYPFYYGLFFVATGFLDLRRRSRWVPLLVAGSTVVAVEYIAEFLGIVNLSISGSFWRVARVEGLMLPIGTLLVAAAWLFERRGHRRLLCGLALLPIALALLLTIGRGMWIATATGLGALGLLILLDRVRRVGRVQRLVLLALVPTIVLGLGFAFERVTQTGVTGSAYRKLSRVQSPEADHSISGRLVSYGVALKAIQERPVMGGGHGMTVSWPVTMTAIPHIATLGTVDNVYLTLGMRMGAVGVAAFVWLYGSALLLALRGFLRSRSPDDRLLYGGFFAVYCAMLVYGLADATLITTRLVLIHAVFLGFVARLAADDGLERRYRIWGELRGNEPDRA